MSGNCFVRCFDSDQWLSYSCTCLFSSTSNPEQAQRAVEEEARKKAARAGSDKKKKRTIRKLSEEDIDMMNNPEAWDDSSTTTTVWDVINRNDMKTFRDLLLENPELAHIRSKDGRGPMWWAHEYGRSTFVTLLKKLGVSETLPDANGITPLSLSTVAKD